MNLVHAYIFIATHIFCIPGTRTRYKVFTYCWYSAVDARVATTRHGYVAPYLLYSTHQHKLGIAILHRTLACSKERGVRRVRRVTDGVSRTKGVLDVVCGHPAHHVHDAIIIAVPCHELGDYGVLRISYEVTTEYFVPRTKYFFFHSFSN